MKKYKAESGVLYVGECSEMKAIYKSMVRAHTEWKSIISPCFPFPVFRSDALVGIVINDTYSFYMVQGDRLAREITGIWA